MGMPEKYALSCGIPSRFANRFRNFAERRRMSASLSENSIVYGPSINCRAVAIVKDFYSSLAVSLKFTQKSPFL